MARPSFRRRRLAGESGGGRDGYLCARRGPRQERLQRAWAGFVRCGCDASQGKAGDADCSGGEDCSVRCRDGGLLRGSSSRPRVRRPRPRRSADVARICPALHQGAEERRSRRRGDRGGGDPADDALCRTEEPGPTRHADTSSIARPVGRGADSSDQSVARHSAGARNGAPQGKRKLEQFLAVLMDEQGGAGLSSRMIELVADARAQWAELDRRISAFEAEFVRWVKENEEARRLTTIPGVGPIVASALVAAIGRAESFDRGRDLAAWLGLVPRQFTTGGKPKLLGISKRGNKYLRRQLIHGARAALPYVAERDTPLGRWAKGLMSRAHRNVVVVAFANKLARIAWAVLRRGERFTAPGMPVAA